MDPESNNLPAELSAALERLDGLVCAFEEHPDPAVQNRVVELLQCVDLVHRTGLRRVAELLSASGLQQPALNAPEVRLLFQLYDLTEDGERARAEAVLDRIRPAVAAQGGRLELVDVTRGVISVRLSGGCGGCQNSLAALREAIEQTLRDSLSDFGRLEIIATEPSPAGFVPLASLRQLE